MSTMDVQRRDKSGMTDVGNIDMKIEVIVIPVADVDRATEFYGRLGWRLDVTPPIVVQFTPHGSACSVQFGTTLTSAAPGSGKGYLVVSDLQATRDALVGAGVEVSGIFHISPSGPVIGPDPEHRSYFSRATFRDPDGNEWLLQEITTRLPGRIGSEKTSFGVRERPRRGVPSGRRRTRRAREPHRPGRRQLAGLVRTVHGGRAGRDRAALMRGRGSRRPRSG